MTPDPGALHDDFDALVAGAEPTAASRSTTGPRPAPTVEDDALGVSQLGLRAPSPGPVVVQPIAAAPTSVAQPARPVSPPFDGYDPAFDQGELDARLGSARDDEAIAGPAAEDDGPFDSLGGNLDDDWDGRPDFHGPAHH